MNIEESRSEYLGLPRTSKRLMAWMKQGESKIWLLIAIGVLLLLWGTGNTMAAFLGALEVSPDDEEEIPGGSFVPYVVPVEAETLAGGDYGGGLALKQFSRWLDSETQTALLEYEELAPQQTEAPIRLVIDSIGLNAPVVDAQMRLVWLEAQQYEQWLAPEQKAVGWHIRSARLGEAGNTVLNGHHNAYGEVFRRLEDVQLGDVVMVSGRNRVYRYIVVNRMILPERKRGAEERLENARWISPSEDERLTLVTCYPYESNNYRLILVARRIN